jgi:hypothetical protein
VLAREPERQTVALCVVESVRAGVRWGPEPPLFGWWDGGDASRDSCGAVIATPPYPLLLATVPAAAVDDLVGELRTRVPDLVGVNGEREAVEAFAAQWTTATGLRSELFMEQRLYRLADPSALTPEVHPGRAPAWRDLGRAVHRHGQPNDQRDLPADRLPAGGGPGDPPVQRRVAATSGRT